MQTGLYQSASSLSALSQVQDTLAFNLAQSSTVAYKRRALTMGTFAQQLNMAGAQVSLPQPIERIDYSQGTLMPTGNVLDLAIQNPIDGKSSGFFKLNTPNGPRYTRGGTFSITTDGSLVNMNGDKLVMSGPIPDINSPISIDENGSISQNGRATGIKITMVDFPDLQRVVPEGAFRYYADPGNERASLATIRSGYLERSNADPVDQLVQLITIHRSFESSTRAMRTLDEALQRTTTRA